MSIPKTYGDAVAQGYKIGHTVYTRGYVSRKKKITDAAVMVAGGNMAGRLYVLGACYKSSQYCYRHYLTAAK